MAAVPPVDEPREFHVGVLGVTGFVGKCRVLITTVGPYMLYGEPVARACVEARTHYCDLTAEMPFVAMLHARHGLAAKERGVKLISFCGFDSIPSDLCVFMIQNKAIELTGKPCKEVKLAVRSIRGGVSGATIESALNVMGHSSMSNPYYLLQHAADNSQTLGQQLPVQPRVCALHYDQDFGYSTFFVMSRVNENVVRWTNALLGYRYGPGFVYYEMLACSFNLLTAAVVLVCTYTSLLAVGCPVSRMLLRLLRLLPAAGEGPGVRTLRSGCFRMEAVGRCSVGTLRAAVGSSWGDPGYSETAKMIAETALAVALELSCCSKLTGTLSPAAAVGEPLIRRLRDKGLQCEVNLEPAAAAQQQQQQPQQEETLAWLTPLQLLLLLRSTRRRLLQLSEQRESSSSSSNSSSSSSNSSSNSRWLQHGPQQQHAAGEERPLPLQQEKQVARQQKLLATREGLLLLQQQLATRE
ncbi:saccharopine dehydrogenase, putative [Eimeria tenella]|uniref:Saccharopine dehydrogenase, putative n=2 Tax=Eimeria TaxID=5800 RepID=U6KPG4_EIMTE|nr:saccharopine dehydrogenase, putative [Eimeria tenella]CDJ38187.1 saccharopine dehydrogenase, putative [Eimeria tenella]|eukprot:XP_013229025.1 saccharopine dehydrogenase, putative [Eimeria tenella]